ncbi:MAG: Cell division trigger factor, partial [uncultured Gemmatimonadetes bacterium]
AQHRSADRRPGNGRLHAQAFRHRAAGARTTRAAVGGGAHRQLRAHARLPQGQDAGVHRRKAVRPGHRAGDGGKGDPGGLPRGAGVRRPPAHRAGAGRQRALPRRRRASLRGNLRGEPHPEPVAHRRLPGGSPGRRGRRRRRRRGARAAAPGPRHARSGGRHPGLRRPGAGGDHPAGCGRRGRGQQLPLRSGRGAGHSRHRGRHHDAGPGRGGRVHRHLPRGLRRRGAARQAGAPSHSPGGCAAQGAAGAGRRVRQGAGRVREHGRAARAGAYRPGRGCQAPRRPGRARRADRADRGSQPLRRSGEHGGALPGLHDGRRARRERPAPRAGRRGAGTDLATAHLHAAAGRGGAAADDGGGAPGRPRGAAGHRRRRGRARGAAGGKGGPLAQRRVGGAGALRPDAGAGIRDHRGKGVRAPAVAERRFARL